MDILGEYSAFFHLSTNEEMEMARAEEEGRKERRSEGLYYMGILQGLLLGIGGNLIVAYFMEVLRTIVSVEWWLVTNIVGFIVGMVLVLWISWSLFVKAGKSIYGSSYEEALKQRVKWKISSLWKKLKHFLRHGRLVNGYPA